MRRRLRSTVRGALALAIAALLACASLLASASAIAGTALIMGGNAHPLSIPQDTPDYISGFVAAADNAYIAPSGLCGAECLLVAVYTPEQIKFVTGLFDMTFDDSVSAGQDNLDACIQGAACTVTLAPYTDTKSRAVADDTYVVYGYSQSATAASDQKLHLIAHPVASTVSFVMVANPNRPNGGILQRFVGAYLPLLGVTFNGATPTFSPQPKPLTTVDVARQYDGWADFPTNPLNLLADLNAMIGTVLLHPNYFDAGTPELQGQYQDSTYYLIPAALTPLLLPLTWVPIVGKPLAIALDPAVRVLVEMGYDRTVNPGQPTAADFIYVPNLIRAALNFLTAIPTGWDDAISYLTGDPDCRPFHTTVQASPFGVGGPPVYAGAFDPYGEPTPYLELPDEARTETAPGAAIPDVPPAGTQVQDSGTATPATDITPPFADLTAVSGGATDVSPAAVDNDGAPEEDPPSTDDGTEGADTLDQSRDDPIENASTALDDEVRDPGPSPEDVTGAEPAGSQTSPVHTGETGLPADAVA